MSLYTVQLYAYNDQNKLVELDLYQEEPIKLTLSAESITDIVRIDSSFSRTFRIPATNTNSQFFSWWYEASIVNFDVTQRIRAEIHVNGTLYSTGQLRLQGAYQNNFRDNVDLEVVFLGETKDFSTEVGDGYLNSLDLGDTAHDLTIDNVEDSWLDFGDVNLLFDGKIRYIPAVRGYVYDDSGNILNSSGGSTDVGEFSRGKTQSFTSTGNAVNINQFTPTIQIKYLVDKIFALTNYTYSTNSIFNEDWFQYLYTDAINATSPFVEGVSQGFEVDLDVIQEYSSSVEDDVEYTSIVDNPVNAYSTSTFTFTVPVDGSYTLTSVLNGNHSQEPFGGSVVTTVRMKVNGSTVDTDSQSDTGANNPFTLNLSHSASLTAGDVVKVTVEGSGGFERGVLISGTFQTTSAPIAVNFSNLLKDDIKLIDFFKSVLSKFRCVMVPSKEQDNEFIVKPWNDYIAQGDEFDWTNKVDGNKDLVMKPVFFNQSANITFTDQEDEDSINKYHQEQFNTIYGTRFYNSGSDLLVDTRTVSTVFAPTPANQIPGDEGGEFITPYLSVWGTEPDQDGDTQRLPLTPQPRLMYWNGFVAAGFTWYYTDGTLLRNESDYPRMTYVDEIPTTSDTLNLNWKKAFSYFELNGGPEGDLGEDVFQRYWQDYVDELYSPDSRMLTGYFTIDAEDLRDLTFDDAIFIKDSWWRVQKIYDAPLTDVASVKVDLLKIIQYPKPVGEPPVSSFTWEWDDANDRVQFTDTSTNSPTSWSWTFSAGTPSSTTEQNPTLEGVLWDEITVTLTASNGGGTGTLASQTFYVRPVEFTDIQYWWRADSGITNGSGSDVSAWTDQINSFDIAQSTASKQPIETTSATLNGKPVVSFNGSTDYLNSATTPASNSGRDITVLSVYNIPNTPPGEGNIFGFEAIGSFANRFWFDGLSGKLRLFDGMASAGNGVTYYVEEPMTTGAKSFKYRYDYSAGDAFRAYNTLTETTLVTGGASRNIGSSVTAMMGSLVYSVSDGRVFGGRYIEMEMAETIVIYGSPTTDQMNAWKTYVNARYGTIIT